MTRREITSDDVGPELIGKTVVARWNRGGGGEISGIVEATGSSLLGPEIRLRGGEVISVFPPKKGLFGGAAKPNKFGHQVWLVE